MKTYTWELGGNQRPNFGNLVGFVNRKKEINPILGNYKKIPM